MIDSEGIVMGGVLVLLAVLLVFAIKGSIQEQHAWDRFQVDHKCRIVGETDSSTGIGPTFGGKGGVAVVIVPGKTGWLCDDGVTYWRSK